MGDELEGDWPKCPHHGNIVMLPKIVSGVASWTCRADPGHHVRIGNLAIDLF
jgi:hypothetical protein